MRKILFRADANSKIGTGDLQSLIYLSEYFKGWQRYFVVKNTTLAKNILKIQGVRDIRFIPKAISKQEEVNLINRFICKNNIDVFFLEMAGSSLMPYTRISAHVKACVDFFGKIPHGFDLVVNWDTAAKKLYNNNEYPDTRFMLGPKYALLKKEIINKANIRNRRMPKDKKRRNILIFFGGLDEFNFTLKTVKVLTNISIPLNIRIIIGSGYKHRKELSDFVKGQNVHNYRIDQNIADMQRYYLWADILIGAGGLSLFEATALKIPTIVIATYRHQVPRCLYFDNMGIISYLGYRKLDENKFLNAIGRKKYRYYKNNFLATSIPGVICERLNYKA